MYHVKDKSVKRWLRHRGCRRNLHVHEVYKPPPVVMTVAAAAPVFPAGALVSACWSVLAMASAGSEGEARRCRWELGSLGSRTREVGMRGCMCGCGCMRGCTAVDMEGHSIEGGLMSSVGWMFGGAAGWAFGLCSDKKGVLGTA